MADLVLNTDRPLDKIIYKESGSIYAANGSPASQDVPHIFSFAPLVYGYYSLSPDFDICYTFPTGPTSNNPMQAPFGTSLSVMVDNQKTNIQFGNYYYGSAVTLYYRLFGLMPSNINVDVPNTNINTDTFMINSDQEQLQLIASNYYDFPTMTFGSPIVTVPLLNHNLGHRVEVMFWVERNGIIDAGKNISMPGNGSVDMSSDLTDVYAVFSPTVLAGRLHYRIYENE